LPGRRALNVKEFAPGTDNTREPYIVSLTLPAGVTSVKASDYSSPTFKNFTTLTEFNAAAVETVGNYAFYNCTLETIDLPASLTTIGVNPFVRCTKLTAINVDSGNLAFQGQGGMLLDKAETTLITYPAATGSIAGALSGIITVGNDAFYGCTALPTVSLPVVQTVGDDAFYYCTGLTTVSLPAATSIGRGAFCYTGSKALTVTLGPAAPTLGAEMFMLAQPGRRRHGPLRRDRVRLDAR
jgi:hypothetical protein